MIFTEWHPQTVWLALLLPALLLSGFALWMLNGISRITHSLNNPSSNSDDTHPTLFSVIIAAHNEEKRLRSTIPALAAIDFPADRVEFILINDRSRDATLSLLESEAVLHPNWRVLSSTPSPGFRGKVNALRCGTGSAKGDFLLFLDADCVPPPHWLQDYDRIVSQYDVIPGHIALTEPVSGFWSVLLNLEHLLSSLQVLAGCGQGRPLFARGGNWGYSRRLLAACGGWNSLKGKRWGDDILMMDLFRRQPGCRFGYTLEGTVSTPPPSSWRSWLRAALRRYGKVTQLSPSSRWLHFLFYLGLLLLPLIPLMLPQLLLPWLIYYLFTLLLFLCVLRKGASLLRQRFQSGSALLFLLLFPPLVLLLAVTGTLLNSAGTFTQDGEEELP